MDNLIISTEDSEYEGSSQPPDLEPIGYHFRFTFSDQDKELKCLEDSSFINRCKLIHRSFVSKLMETGYVYLGKLTSGFEVRNKAGENCKAHMHISFKSKYVKQSMNRTFKRYLEGTWEQEYLGNACYSFKEQHIRCEDEFWRYPLKQSFNKNLCRGFNDDKLEVFHQVAKESYAKVCQVHQSKLDKKDTPDTLFLKVIHNIKKLPILPKNAREIARHFVIYYKEHNLPINNVTIKGYVTLAMLHLDIMTVDEYIDTLNL